MREIKFRAWIDDSKRLEYVERIDFLSKLILFCGKSTWNDYEYEDIIIEQFTGLHDKNGVEIYENDICLVSCKYFNIKNEKSTVIFKDGCFCFQYGCTDDYVKTYNAWDLNSIEVIGNIHERSKQDEEVE